MGCFPLASIYAREAKMYMLTQVYRKQMCIAFSCTLRNKFLFNFYFNLLHGLIDSDHYQKASCTKVLQYHIGSKMRRSFSVGLKRSFLSDQICFSLKSKFLRVEFPSSLLTNFVAVLTYLMYSYQWSVFRRD